MRCGFCKYQTTRGIRDYPQREQLQHHQERDHLAQLRYHQKLAVEREDSRIRSGEWQFHSVKPDGRGEMAQIDIQIQSAVIRAIKRLQRTRREWSLLDWDIAVSHLKETMLTGIALRDHSIQASLPEPGKEG